MNILLTGGAGYIGSHTCVELLNNNHSIIIADNLCNSRIETLINIESITSKKFFFYESDVTLESNLERIFSNHEINGVIHFAGFKSVAESIKDPMNYYYNNIVSTMLLTKVCLKYGVDKFVFSSSATVYGDNKSPMNEAMHLLNTMNPYGETKAMSERILMDISKANPNFSVAILRYFNPVGAHESGLIGEDPKGIPNNLMPIIAKVAKGELKQLKVFGNDYETVDGTGVRDYIHVMDLAKGHVAAVEMLKKGVHIYNLGTGKGTSVLELINTFQEVNDVKIPYELVERRSGDIAVCYADTSKAERELGWKTEYSIREMVKDVWRFEKMQALP